MVKKLKSLAGGNSGGNLAETIKASAQQIWLAGLGAFSRAQEEGNKMFESLVKEGEAIQARTRKAAEVKVGELAARATGGWDKLEQVFEDRVAQALNSLGVPSKKDVDTLSKRVAELVAQMNASSRVAPTPAARRRPTVKPAAHRPTAK